MHGVPAGSAPHEPAGDALLQQAAPARLYDRQQHAAFFAVTVLFFLWALPNNLNDVLIRQFMKSFRITRLEAGLVQSAFYLGYFCVSVPAALVLRRLGYKAGLVCGLLLYAAGCLLFWPAAAVDRYGLFLLALFVIASGLAFLETGAGAFIAGLGPAASSERRVNFAQSFNPLGAISGALLGTTLIFSGLDPSPAQVSRMEAAGQYRAFLHTETLRVVAPYLVLGGLVLAFALLLARVRFPPEQARDGERGSVRALARVPHFRAAVTAQFFYMGAQVGTWSFLIQYAIDYTRQGERAAGYFLSGTLTLFAVGRFAATALMRSVRPNRLVGAFALTNLALLAAAIAVPGWWGLTALVATSFFMAPMYPTIFALGLKNLGPNTTLGASVLVMAIIGGAALTPGMGWAAERAGSMAVGYTVPLAAYAVVAWFAFAGSRISFKT